MSYTTQTNVQNKFGETNVKKWSNLDNTSDSLNTTRLTAAIAFADAYIDDRFRGGRYLLPFSPVPVMVMEWASILAGWWLYFSRGQRDEDDTNQYQKHKDNVDKEIGQYRSGMRKFDSALHIGDLGPTGAVTVGA